MDTQNPRWFRPNLRFGLNHPRLRRGQLCQGQSCLAPHVAHVSHIPVHAVQDVVGALLRHALAERVQVTQLRAVIAAPHPAQVVQVHGVRHAEILERAQQLAIDGLRQADLRRNAPVEVPIDVLAIHALRGEGNFVIDKGVPGKAGDGDGSNRRFEARHRLSGPAAPWAGSE